MKGVRLTQKQKRPGRAGWWGRGGSQSEQEFQKGRTPAHAKGGEGKSRKKKKKGGLKGGGFAAWGEKRLPLPRMEQGNKQKPCLEEKKPRGKGGKKIGVKKGNQPPSRASETGGKERGLTCSKGSLNRGGKIKTPKEKQKSWGKEDLPSHRKKTKKGGGVS